MDFKGYLAPYKPDKKKFLFLSDYEYRLINYTTFYNDSIKLEDFEKKTIAIIGVPEERNSYQNQGCAKAPDKLRESLYALFTPSQTLKIIDFGNIITGKTTNDTYAALRDVIFTLRQKNFYIIVIGGSQDLVYGIYLAYEKLKQVVNITTIDPKLDLGNAEQKFDSQTYLSKIILEKGNYLFNHTHIGYQTYFVSPRELHLIKKLHFDSVRLGIARTDIKENEPILRDTDILNIDISAIKQSDAPAHKHPSINGFYSEEICQLTKYAAFGDKLSILGIFEINPDFDIKNQTTELAAQIIWFGIEGFATRKKDFPNQNPKQYKKFFVQINKYDDLVFYKSIKTNRWWIEVPHFNSADKIIISCSYNDYITATSNEVPERWLNFYKKLR